MSSLSLIGDALCEMAFDSEVATSRNLSANYLRKHFKYDPHGNDKEQMSIWKQLTLHTGTTMKDSLNTQKRTPLLKKLREMVKPLICALKSLEKGKKLLQGYDIGSVDRHQFIQDDLRRVKEATCLFEENTAVYETCSKSQVEQIIELLTILSALYSEEQVKDRRVELIYDVLRNEDDTTFGYHGTKTVHAIFQEVVRAVVQEATNLPIPEDFYFFRIPGQDYHTGMSGKKFLKMHPDINDNDYEMQKFLVSVNLALTGNHDRAGECSLNYCFSNRSANGGISRAVSLLQDLEKMAGLKSGAAKELFDIAKSIEDFSTGVRGVLLQLSEKGAKKREFKAVEGLSYLAQAWGRRAKDSPEPKRKIFDILKSKEVIPFDQIRLIINNEQTLNPFGPFSMKVYRVPSDEAVRAMRKQLIAKVHELVADAAILKAYGQKLKTLWGLTPRSRL
ncbi:MAG: hypothetical protein P0S95_02915 [Rhabdochlamydiaceae bacterium]|nr:hypothetical protein [Candidatus Amphrikana amoebophyrae]